MHIARFRFENKVFKFWELLVSTIKKYEHMTNFNLVWFFFIIIRTSDTHFVNTHVVWNAIPFFGMFFLLELIVRQHSNSQKLKIVLNIWRTLYIDYLQDEKDGLEILENWDIFGIEDDRRLLQMKTHAPTLNFCVSFKS